MNKTENQAINCPKTYFDLIEKVNSNGKYQRNITIIFFLVWFVTGVILMSTALLFYNYSFNCKEKGFMVDKCEQKVCALPREQWVNFIANEDVNRTSIATDFGTYLCSDTTTLDFASSATYFGAFMGYIIISFFSDNFGRRTSLVVSWAVTVFGTIILAASQNILMAAVGLFFSGAGADAALNICFFFFAEAVGEEKRQKYSVVIQISFVFGSMVTTLLFYLIADWRIVWIISSVIPAVVSFALIFFYIEQTPQFLVKQGVEKTLKALNRIGKINNGVDRLLTQEDVQNVILFQVNSHQQVKLITPLDLLYFPSLRKNTIICSIICFMTYAMYYGPTLIVADIGFNIYISSIIVQLSDFLVYFPAYLWIERIRRQAFGIILFSISTVMAAILVFVNKPEGCTICTESLIQLSLIFIFRFCVAFFFCFFQMYVCELYPARARGIGFGIVSAVGTLASSTSPILLGFLARNNINVMSFFVLFGVIALGCLTLLDETKGMPLKEEIDEIEMEKEKRRSQIGESIHAKSFSARKVLKNELVSNQESA